MGGEQERGRGQGERGQGLIEEEGEMGLFAFMAFLQSKHGQRSNLTYYYQLESPESLYTKPVYN